MDGEIISLALAKAHLRVTATAEDGLLGTYIRQAERALLEYLGFADIDAFYYEHGEVNADILLLAVMLMLSELYDKRSTAPLTDAVKSVVRRFRDPVISDPVNAD